MVPLVGLQIVQRLLPVVVWVAVGHEDDHGDLIAGFGLHHGVTGQLAIQFGQRCAQISHAVSLQVRPNKVFHLFQAVVTHGDPAAAAVIFHDSQLKGCVGRGLADLSQFVNGIAHCVV